MTEKTIEKTKNSSRKFIVWAVWCLVTLAIIITSYVGGNDDGLTKEALSDFFIISMLYLGANVGQKAIYAHRDVKVNENADN